MQISGQLTPLACEDFYISNFVQSKGKLDTQYQRQAITKARFGRRSVTKYNPKGKLTDNFGARNRIAVLHSSRCFLPKCEKIRKKIGHILSRMYV